MTDAPSFEHIDVRLTSDEALVLFELLSRWVLDGEAIRPAPETFVSPAEPTVLSCVLATLETQLGAPFASDYAEQVERARRQLVEAYGGDVSP